MAYAIERLRYAGYIESGQDYEIALDRSPDCIERTAESCAAHGRDVYCDKSKLTRVITALGAAVLNMELKDGIVSSTLDMTKSIMLADVVLNPNTPDSERLTATLLQDYSVPFERVAATMVMMPGLYRWDVLGDDTIIKSNPLISLLHPAMEGAVNYFLAYVLGHELAHAFSRCPFEEPSHIEATGLFRNFVGVQSGNQLFCPNPLLIDEVLADRCALRVVRRMDEAMKVHKEAASKRLFGKFPSPIQAFHSVSRRLAIDALALVLATGLSSTSTSFEVKGPGADGLPTTAYQMRRNPGYLYRVIRLGLFAQELKETEPYNPNMVRLCDESAQLFALAAAETLTCGGDSELDTKRLITPFGQFVPKGVSEGWRTGHFNDAPGGSFACDAQ